MKAKNIKNQKVLYYVKAIKNWNKQDNEEISFEKGDKIAILFDSESWWYGYVVNSNNPKPGFFPNIVVQKIPEKKTNNQVSKIKKIVKDNESSINFNSDDEDEIQIGVEFNENEKTSEISLSTSSETSEDLPLNMLSLTVENLRKMNELESDKKEKNKKKDKQEQNFTNSLFSSHKQKEKTRQKENTRQKEKTRQKVRRKEIETEIEKKRNKSKKKTKKIPPPKPKKKPKDFKRTIQQPNNNHYRSNKKTDKNKQQENNYLENLEYVAKQKKKQNQKQKQFQKPRQTQKQKKNQNQNQKQKSREKEKQKEKEREIAGYDEIFLKSNFTWKENVTKEINKYEILPDPKKKKKQFLIKCIKGPNKERIESIHKIDDFKQLRELLTKYEPLSIPILNIGEKDTQINEIVEYFINSLSRHPILRNTKEFEKFLESKTPKEWKNSIKKMPQKITRFNFFENFETKLNTNKLESNYQKSLMDFKRYLNSLEKNIKTIKNDWNGLHNRMNDLGHSYSNLAKSFDRFSGFGGVEWRDPTDIVHETELDSLKISTSLVSLTGFMKRTSSTYNDDNSNIIKTNNTNNNSNNKGSSRKNNNNNSSSSSNRINDGSFNNNGESSKKIINSNLNKILFDISSTNESLNRFSHLQSQEIAQQNIYLKVQNNKDTNKIQTEFQKLNKLQKDSNIFELSMIAESELFKRNTLKNLKNTMTNYLKHQIDLNHQFSTELRDIYNLVSSAKIESGVYYIEKNNEEN
ncbi:sorting nexin [Anaeramoeba flamelloides]|uniref:Sorting nexin n=1 Tax=Anaeramoeba flamelloides TaxID=1746091 RepID=A0ABQ8XD03_9EUKA|nr:sorting nexin [Anaeramoeba flamelloides]